MTGNNEKKPIFKQTPDDNPVNHSGLIRNKLKRNDVYAEYLQAKKKRKKDSRLRRAKEVAELGEGVEVKKQTPRTLDNTRENEVSMVDQNDKEVMADEAGDEFAAYFTDDIRPKVLITTRPGPSKELFTFIQDLMQFIPQMFYYPRKRYSVKEICGFAKNKDFTHLIVLSEKSKVCDGMIISHLRSSEENSNEGPTAFFKVSNVIPSSSVPHHGRATNHIPELVLNGFGTRLGHRVGRFLGSLFPHNAQFRGRQVATFHNQRDFIFVRHHRYIFGESKQLSEETGKNKTEAKLQELGPRFTLKMRWMQHGVFDTHFGEYEWLHKRKEMDTTRRKFHL